MQQSVTRLDNANSRENPRLLPIKLSQIDRRQQAEILQLLDRLAKLSGLTSAERVFVAKWRALKHVPAHQFSSFEYICRKHLRRAA